MATAPYSLTARTAKPPQNSTILITGGASGIGLATALYLHSPEYNNNIAILDLSDARSFENTPGTSELPKSARFLYIQCNILDWAEQRDAFSKTALKFNGIDCVFINAGVAEIGDQIWKDTYDSNGKLSAPSRLTIDVDIRAVGDTLKLAAHHLRADSAASSERKGSGKGKGGSIVMTASLAGYLASAGAPLYSAAKHGVVGYMRALKSDCARAGIAISVIAPGITLTNIILGLREGQSLEDWGKEMAGRGVPINDAETVALVVAQLMGMGMGANGMGLLIQGNRVQELEGGIAKGRANWMGKEMLELFRGGRDAPLFPNKL